MEYADHQNKTGIYLANGMYSPIHERRATVPVMLYRGHMVKYPQTNLDEYYYHRHVVKKYHMHTLNAGFAGKLAIPVKDKRKFKIPSQRTFQSTKPGGKWTNFPMSIEVGKYTQGYEGHVDNPALPPVPEKHNVIVGSRTSSRFFNKRASTTSETHPRPAPSPLDYTDDVRLYDDIEPEIMNIMTMRNELYQSYQNRIESVLQNDDNYYKDLRSMPVSRLGFISEQKFPKSLPTRRTPKPSSYIAEDAKTNLLLPVPFVMPGHLSIKFQQSRRAYSAPTVSPG